MHDYYTDRYLDSRQDYFQFGINIAISTYCLSGVHIEGLTFGNRSYIKRVKMYRTSPIRARSKRITFFTDIVEKTRFPWSEARFLKNMWHWEYHEMDKHGPYSLNTIKISWESLLSDLSCLWGTTSLVSAEGHPQNNAMKRSNCEALCNHCEVSYVRS